MNQYIDGFHIAAEVRLLRHQHKGAILIVEGGTDAKVFDRFVDKALCKTQVAFGKKNVIDALDRLEDDGFEGVVAVIDADFDRLLGVVQTLDSLCETDLHDLDLTIFGSAALENYVREHADDALFDKNFGRDIGAVRSAVLDACKPIACCRFLSQKVGLRLNFKDIRLEDYVDAETLAINCDALWSKIIAQSSAPPSLTAIKGIVENEVKADRDIYQLTNGHDASAMLGLALRKKLGKRRDVHTWQSEIEAGLRLAFDSEAFAATNIYSWLRSWEARTGVAIF